MGDDLLLLGVYLLSVVSIKVQTLAPSGGSRAMPSNTVPRLGEETETRCECDTEDLRLDGGNYLQISPPLKDLTLSLGPFDEPSSGPRSVL